MRKGSTPLEALYISAITEVPQAGHADPRAALRDASWRKVADLIQGI